MPACYLNQPSLLFQQSQQFIGTNACARITIGQQTVGQFTFFACRLTMRASIASFATIR